MASVKLSILTCGLILLTPMAALAQAGQKQDLTGSGGLCAPVATSVPSLEWGISKHCTITNLARVPNCTGCHGPSKGHVADEQNGVKPDRIPRGDAIAGLCKECHQRLPENGQGHRLPGLPPSACVGESRAEQPRHRGARESSWGHSRTPT